MTGGELRTAMRQMLRIPAPRARARHWIALAILLGGALALQLAIGLVAWDVFALAAGIGLGVPALFVGLGRGWGWIAVAFGLALGLGMIPLFGVLGLELALVTAFVAAIFAADLGAALARELARMPARGIERAIYPGRAVLRGALASACLASGVTLVVGAVAALRGIVVPTCDWRFGVTTFAALPLATAALFGAAGHAMGALAGPRRYLAAALAQLPALAVAIAAVWRFHASPPVYTYNAILGYFPGNMYDEHVQLLSPLAWSRLEQLAWVIALGAVVALRLDVASYRVRLRAPRPAARRTAPAITALVAIAVAIALRWNGGALGFAVDAEDLERALGGRLETAHFVIFYAPTPEIEADLALIAADHEFRYAQVVGALGAAPPGKLTSFYFADEDQKARLHGSRDVEMAKPWRREIYLEHRAFPHPSLRHEIAHAVASAFGDPLWGVATRDVAGIPVLAMPGLIEGLAVAADWPGGYDRPNPDEAVRIMQGLGKEPQLAPLFGLQFFGVSPTQGYATAGSFLHFLLATRGAAKLRALYASGGDFEAAYGESLPLLERAWRDHLAEIEVSPAVIAAQKERFRAVSVFAKPCPHAIAATRRRAIEALADGDRDRAIELMYEVCTESQGEPRYVIDLGDVLAGGDELEQATALGRWQRVAFDATGVTTTVRAAAIERLARAAMRADDHQRASQLVAYGRALPLDLGERRQLDAMAVVLAHAGPAGDHLRGVLFPSERSDLLSNSLAAAEAAVAAEPALPFAHYLVAIQYAVKQRWTEAAQHYELALGGRLPGLSFVKNAARRLAIAAYRTGDTARLTIALGILRGPEMSSGDRLFADDFAERQAFADRSR